MARSGPVWEQLSAPTQQSLLQATCGLLLGGTGLKRLLPWLWPLADTAAAAGQVALAAPAALRHQLLAALAAYPLPIEEQQQLQEGDSASSSAAAQTLGDKRELLLSALRAVWI